MSKPSPIKVPLVDLKGQYRKMRAEVRRAVDEVLDSQLFILGPAVKKFEEAAASYLKCSAAVGLASGSDALLLCFLRLPFFRPPQPSRVSVPRRSLSTSTHKVSSWIQKKRNGLLKSTPDDKAGA